MKNLLDTVLTIGFFTFTGASVYFAATYNPSMAGCCTGLAYLMLHTVRGK